MNSKVKSSLIFITGFVAGGLVTRWLMIKALNAEFGEEEYYEPMPGEIPDEIELENNPEGLPDGVYKLDDNTKQLLAYRRETKKHTPYDQLSVKPPLSSIMMEGGSEPETEDENSPIYVIHVEEFNNGKPYHDKLSLFYYNVDDVLVDESENIIDDPASIIGDDALVSFGVGSSDSDVVYVRNNRLSIDYEIARVNKSYQVTVLGIMPQAPSRKKARNGDED